MNTTEENFNIIPAIDILNGKCVRLTQGDYKEIEKFSDNPVDIALTWKNKGAKRLHLVDLDGAKDGITTNFNLIKEITKATSCSIQVGGGIRSIESIKKYLDCGIDFTILGTKAFKDKDFLDKAIETFGEKIIVGLDMKDKKVALSGWQEVIETNFNDLIQYLDSVNEVIFTDISKDGMLSGPNLESVDELASSLKSRIIVSGGLSKLHDISSILKLRTKRKNISGVILGKSLYKKTIDLEEAIQLAKSK